MNDSSALLIQILFMAVCGAICAWLAKRKNRNPWAWGIAGAVFSIVTLLVMACMQYKCPKCGEALTNEQGQDKECPTCGSFEAA